ncbi:MAG: hypothetical protein KJ941_10005 [Bacteroidetes bacterium]|nr:hypothetical protein [Bacteroidota bacterium]
MMHLKNFPKVIFFTLLSSIAYGQIAAEELPIGSIFKKHYYGGPVLSTAGVGAQFVFDRSLDFKNKVGIQLSVQTLKSHREYRKSNPQYDDSKSYIYGKVNALAISRLQLQYKYLIFEKKRERGVKIQGIISAGALFGWLKPNYVKIRDPFIVEKNTKPVDTPYNPDEQLESFVYGRSSHLMGVSEGKKQCGFSGRAGFIVDFSPKENQIIGLELGIQLDRLSNKVNLFYKGESFQNFPSLYTSLVIGLNKT